MLYLLPSPALSQLSHLDVFSCTIDYDLFCSVHQAAVYESIRESGHNIDFLFGSSMTGLRVDRVDSNTFGPAVVTLSSPSTSPAADSGSGSGAGVAVKTLTAR